MWALNIAAPEGAPANSLQVREILEDTMCHTGTTNLDTIAGPLNSGAFGSNAPLWFIVQLTAERIGANLPQSASLNNGHLSVMMLATPGLRGPFGIVQ
jgi:hypothetical protein